MERKATLRFSALNAARFGAAGSVTRELAEEVILLLGSGGRVAVYNPAIPKV
jgi:hypothetical protein